MTRGSTWWLFEYLKTGGFELTTEPTGDFYIAINHNERAYNEFIRQGGNKQSTVLIRAEPDSVYPIQYKESVSSKYGIVFSPGSVFEIQRRDPLVNHPYLYNINPVNPRTDDPKLSEVLTQAQSKNIYSIENWNARPITATMIASNKVSPSRNNNYHLRRTVARAMSPDTLQVYGPLWIDSLYAKLRHRAAVAYFGLRSGYFPNPFSIYGSLFSRYRTAKGTVQDKHEILRSSKFSIVIENANSCITEKLFDCLLNGAIPIYIGPNLKQYGLPSNIAYVSLGNPNQIQRIITEASQVDIERKLMAISNFIGSRSFSNSWTAEAVYQDVSNEIIFYFGTLKRRSAKG